MIQTKLWKPLEAVSRSKPWLSYQGPLNEFVCLNPLGSFQQWNFHDGVYKAGKAYGAYTLMPLKFYRDAFKTGRITQSAIDRAVHWHGSTEPEESRLKRDLLVYPEGSSERPESFGRFGLRGAIIDFKKAPLTQRATPTLIRLISAYMDQGIASWRYHGKHQGRYQVSYQGKNQSQHKSAAQPNSKTTEDGFYNWISGLTQHSLLKPSALRGSFAKSCLEKSPEDALVECFDKLLGKDWQNTAETRELADRYLAEIAFATPGWSSMVHHIEGKPSSVHEHRGIKLLEFLVVALILDTNVILRFTKAKDLSELTLSSIKKSQSALWPIEHPWALGQLDLIKRVWHDAFEWSIYEQALVGIDRCAKNSRPDQKKPNIQAVFCIDDRECSLRTHIEREDPCIETFGTAGFFGFDFLLHLEGESKAMQNCPIVLSPKHIIRATFTDKSQQKLTSATKKEQHTHSFGLGWISTYFSSIIAGWKLLRDSVYPVADEKSSSSVYRPLNQAKLNLLKSNVPSSNEFSEGYTMEEAAERIKSQLCQMGLTRDFGKVVFIVAHGSSTVNNPHFALYDCGACMGKPGTPNARAFAWFANQAEVRQILKSKNIVIPDHTTFVAALHDTTRDEIVLFDHQDVSMATKSQVDRFVQVTKKALQKNAQERCRRFELVSDSVSAEKAWKIVKNRSVQVFEARPEFTHAGNCLAIVGRRDLTKSVFLDRRAFLNSYDPCQDPEGLILTQILSAVIPVAGGINLTYFFSSLDQEKYGAGSKLPHNVVSLLGIANGVEGDLLLGLPSQMVEIHEPVRLGIVVDQKPEVALGSVRRNPALVSWVENEWVRFMARDPDSGSFWVYSKGTMQPVKLDESYDLKHHVNVSECLRNSTGHVQRGFIPLSNLAVEPCH